MGRARWPRRQPRGDRPVLATFNYAANNHGVASPLKGLKKPPAKPRRGSIDAADETAMYEATECFRSFLSFSIQTGLRPFCEPARLNADDVEEMPRGMMWRVCSSKTKRRRKIPVRPEVTVLPRRLMATALPWSNAFGADVYRILSRYPCPPAAEPVALLDDQSAHVDQLAQFRVCRRPDAGDNGSG